MVGELGVYVAPPECNTIHSDVSMRKLMRDVDLRDLCIVGEVLQEVSVDPLLVRCITHQDQIPFYGEG